MSEEDTQVESSTEFHESMKKEGVDEITAEKDVVKGNEEVTKNGLDTHKSVNKQNSINNEISKENELKNIKTINLISDDDDDGKVDKTEELMDGIEEEGKSHDATQNSDHEDSLNDSKEETLEEVESTEESRLETLEDSRDESTIKRSQKRKNDDSFDQTPSRVKRERKKVERFVQEAKKEEVEQEGHGTALGDIPFIKTMIGKTPPENLKILHRICYARPGSAAEVRRNLYKFRGFPFSRDDKLYERKKASTEKIFSSELKRILVIFGLERKGVKMDLIERTLDFLLNPHEIQKPILTPKLKRSKKDKGKNRKKESVKKNKAEEEDQASGSDEDSKSEEEECDEEEEDEEEEPESEEEEKVVKSKKKSSTKVTPMPKKSKKPQPQKTPKTPPAKPQPKSSQKKKAPPSPSSSEDSDSEDNQPLTKKVKKAPTDAEIKTFIKKLLDKADLEQVTMKKVCQLVYEHYPGQDLSYKKEFIKATVKSILS